MNILLITCKKATELTEKRTHFGLTIPETIRWRMHLAVCTACRTYEKQSRFIEQALKMTVSAMPPVEQVTEHESKELIKKILEK